MPASSIWRGVSTGRKCAGASLKRTSLPSGPSSPEWQGTYLVPVGSEGSFGSLPPHLDAAGGRSLGSAACLRLREAGVDMVSDARATSEESRNRGG